MDMARSMLAEFKSPYNFWGEAISTACHSSNRLFLRKGLNMTPYQILTGSKPNIKYFQVFGCKCFFQRKGVRLGKFDLKAIEGIFPGYGAKSHTYRVFNKSIRHVEESYSVVFKENDSSHGRQDVVACDVDDEIPQDCRWILCRKNMGYHATNPKIRTQGAERVRSRIATKHGDGSLELSNALRTIERDAELYPGSGPSW
jgi:hypothetical protein